MNFTNPEFFAAGILFTAAAVVLWIRSGRVRRRALLMWFGSPEEAERHVRLSRGARLWKRFFMLSGALCLAAAAARPWWGRTVVSAGTSGRDVAILFDVSRSMLAGDTSPSRLAHAKWLARAVVEAHPGDRFALIPFAGRAVISCPLTGDPGALRLYLDDLDTDTVPYGGTDIAAALECAARAFDGAAGDEKAILLITDGEELSGSARETAEKLAGENVKIIVVGIGSDVNSAPIPEKNAAGEVSFKRDRAGNLITTRLNSGLMRDLAAGTGGVYIRSDSADDNLDEVNRAIRRLRSSERDEKASSVPIERFMPFIIAGIILLAAGVFISERPAASVLLAALCCCGVLNAEEAEPPPADAVGMFNAAREMQTGDPETAAAMYAETLARPDADGRIAAGAMLNIGAIRHFEARKLENEAAEAVAGDVRGGIDRLREALNGLDRAEEAYAGALREAPLPEGRADLAALIDDRRRISDRIDELRQLEQQLEEARRAAQQAGDENQQSGGEDQQSGGKDQQSGGEDQQSGGEDQQSGGEDQQSGGEDQQSGNEDQQSGNEDQQSGNEDQQSGGEDQQSGGEDQQSGGEDQQSAEAAAREAAARAESLAEQAARAGADDLRERAERAAGELREAADKIGRDEREAAGEHIRRALDELGRGGADGEDREPGDESGEETSGGPEGDRDDGSGSGADEPPGGESGSDEKPGEGNIDGEQADAVLEQMSRAERDYREQLKRHRAGSIGRPEKDW